MKNTVILLFFLLLYSAFPINHLYGLSQTDFTLSTAVNTQKISLHDYIVLTVTLTGPYSHKQFDPKLTSNSDCNTALLYTSIKVDKQSDVMSFTKNLHYVLEPTKAGMLGVGAAQLRIRKFSWTASSIPVEVVETPFEKPDFTIFTRQFIDYTENDICIQTTVDKKSAFIGEPIVYNVECYHNLTGFKIEFRQPSLTGFLPVEFPGIGSYLSNKRYYWCTIFRKALFPLSSGNLTIDSSAIKYSYQQGAFNQWGTLIAEPITVEIKPLPEKGKPEHFSGAIGSYRIGAIANKHTVAPGDEFLLRVTVSGTGNIGTVTEITEPDLSDYKLYKKTNSVSVPNDGLVVSGSKTWEYALVPQQTGKKTIGVFTLSYFDPKKGAYFTVTTKPIEITVESAGDMTVSGKSNKNVGQTVISSIAKDIRFLKPDKQTLTSTGSKVYPSPLWFLLYLLPVSALIVTYSVKRKHDTLDKSRSSEEKHSRGNRRKDVSTRLPGYWKRTTFQGITGNFMNVSPPISEIC